MFANKYVKVLKPYPLVSHKAWEIKDKKKVLKLDWNEATISPSPKVKEKILDFLEKGNMNWYPDVNNKYLLELIAKYNNIPTENVQYFAGSDSLHEYIMRAFIEPNDKVVIVSPTYDNFRAVIESNGAISNFYYLDEKFDLDIEHFSNYLELHKPKVVYVCNPNNPTGTLYSVEMIEKLLADFQNILFIVDEAYYEFTGVSCKDLIFEYDNLLVSRTFSKAFALASFRIGYVISSQNNIKLLSKIRNPKNISTFSQLAAIGALEDVEYMKNYVEEVNKAKVYFMNELENLNIKTFGDGGNFVLIYMEKNQKKKLIKFLEDNLIFVRDYSHVLGMENYLRITIGTKFQIQKVIEKIKEFLNAR